MQILFKTANLTDVRDVLRLCRQRTDDNPNTNIRAAVMRPVYVKYIFLNCISCMVQWTAMLANCDLVQYFGLWPTLPKILLIHASMLTHYTEMVSVVNNLPAKHQRVSNVTVAVAVVSI